MKVWRLLLDIEGNDKQIRRETRWYVAGSPDAVLDHNRAELLDERVEFVAIIQDAPAVCILAPPQPEKPA